ncbi:MAG: hypothetical protein K8S97_01675 [Anaerolineae bacterium]|nr:hypothetical protein [Anaerolineae bacterium]
MERRTAADGRGGLTHCASQLPTWISQRPGFLAGALVYLTRELRRASGPQRSDGLRKHAFSFVTAPSAVQDCCVAHTTLSAADVFALRADLV